MLLAVVYSLEGKNPENGNNIVAVHTAWAPDGRIDDVPDHAKVISGLLAAIVATGREPLAVTLYGWPGGEKDPGLANIQLLTHTPVVAAGIPRTVVDSALEAALVRVPEVAASQQTAHPEMRVPSRFNPLSN